MRPLGKGREDMKKLLAVIFAVMLMMASGLAQVGTAGYVPEFTNSTGSVANSVLFQSGTSIGIGTTAPAATFHVVGTTPPVAFFEVYSGSAGTALGAIPLNQRGARGTFGNPLPVQPGDELLASTI